MVDSDMAVVDRLETPASFALLRAMLEAETPHSAVVGQSAQ
jgi:hypothetical protein